MKKTVKKIFLSMLAFGLLGNAPTYAAEPGKMQQLSQSARAFFQALKNAPHCLTRSTACSPQDRTILMATGKNFLKILVIVLTALAIRRLRTAKAKQPEQPVAEEAAVIEEEPTQSQEEPQKTERESWKDRLKRMQEERAKQIQQRELEKFKGWQKGLAS